MRRQWSADELGDGWMLGAEDRNHAWNLVLVSGGGHELTGQEPEHVVVVPGSLLPLGAHAGLGGPVATDEVERDLAQDR